MYFPTFNSWRNAGTVALASFPSVKTSIDSVKTNIDPVKTSIETTGDLYIVNTRTSYTKKASHREIPDEHIVRTAVLAGLGPDPKDGTFPGPVINGWKGDTLSINVHNNLRDRSMYTETTIHWHGIEMDHNYWADGVAFVTQCPIIPNDQFTYTFPVKNQAGTFWYHSHYHTQYCDGLRGALIIRDHEDPYLKSGDYDEDGDSDDTIISLADWFLKKESGGESKWELNLMNGQVQPRVDVKPNKKYRFRLINMSCDAAYTFSIDDHKLTVIEVEGVLTKKYQVTHIPVHAGQRYSFILDTAKRPDNYWIRADLLMRDIRGRPSGGRGILHYAGAAENVEPTTNETVGDDKKELVEWEIRSYDEMEAPGEPGWNGEGVYNKNLTLGYKTGVGFTINDVRFKSPEEAVLLQILNRQVDPKEVLPANTVITLPRDTNVQLTFLEGDVVIGGLHPMHMHGHTFSVVRSAGSKDYVWDGTPRRDTVATSVINRDPNNPSEVTIRFKTDNPGPWILHCHMDRHLVAGLAIVFAEDVKETKKLESKIPGGKETLYKNCAKYYDWLGSGRMANFD